MSLGVISIFWFEILGDFWRKITNKGKHEKLGTGPLAVAKGGLAEGKKCHPSSSLQRSLASPR